MALPDGFDLDSFIQHVLTEDLGSGGDVTSNATIAEDARFTAEMNARQAITVGGIDVAESFFRKLDAGMQIELLAKDVDSLHKLPGGNARLPTLPLSVRSRMVAKSPGVSPLEFSATFRVPRGAEGAGTSGSAMGSTRRSRKRNKAEPFNVTV